MLYGKSTCNAAKVVKGVPPLLSRAVLLLYNKITPLEMRDTIKDDTFAGRKVIYKRWNTVCVADNLYMGGKWVQRWYKLTGIIVECDM